MAEADEKQAEVKKNRLIEKLPFFEHADAKEEIVDTSKTFDQLRLEKAEDFPELDEGDNVKWKVTYMHGITLLEDFMELVAKENLFTYANKRDSKHISINSMYVADDEKQRSKMAHEFYRDMGNEIEIYQKRILNLIRNGSSSQKILDRWGLKIQSLESKKRGCEGILKQDLSGIDEKFTMLRDICDQFKFAVKRTQVFGLAA